VSDPSGRHDPEADDLTRAWRRAASALPPDWRLDSLRCLSTGLAPEQRSTRWRAVALGPNDTEKTSDGDNAATALAALVATFAARGPGKASGR
jgi:hypothetical protein